MELVEPMVGHGRPWEVEVLTLGFVKAMGGGGMVEMVEMVEMYLLNKYTRHRLEIIKEDQIEENNASKEISGISKESNKEEDAATAEF
jgi:phage host-nuclease inhibitor protein Gam